MYSKLFARISESSLMEEEIATRYTFMMLLAIADPVGLVIGTDVAIARRLNMDLDQFKASMLALGSPDEASNSKEQQGKRVVPSDGERGYQIVNYAKYRDLKGEDERRQYMRDYMRDYRAVNSVNSVKPPLAKLTHAEADTEAEAQKSKNLAQDALRKEAKTRADLDTIKAFCLDLKLPPSDADWFFYKCEGCGWANNGKPIKDWKATIRAWMAAGYFPSQKSPNGKQTSFGPPADTFWKDKARFDMVEKELQAINARASHTAMDVIIEPRDVENYKRLKVERKTLKEKLNL